MKNLVLKFIIMIAMFAGIAAFSSIAWAQNASQHESMLDDLNRIKPLQNPNWERSREVLKNRIQDNKNRVIGTLNDILLAESGEISSLKVDLNRLRIGADVYLGYQDTDMRGIGGAYKMAIADDEIEGMVPQLLAGIETAAGDSADTVSVRNLINASVESADGRRIGKIQDVMFDSSGNRVEAILVRVRYRSVGGKTVAIPFGAPSYDANGGQYTVKLSDALTDAVLVKAESL